MGGSITNDELVAFFSNFWKLEESLINEKLLIDDTNIPDFSSIRFFQFIAALESNFNLRVNNIERIVCFGDLLENLEKS